MDLSRQRAPENAQVRGIDRRTVLKLCAASLSGAVLSPLVSGCATHGVSYQGGEPAFRPVNPATLRDASGALARVLLSFLEMPTPNNTALHHLDRVLKDTGLWESVLAGPVSSAEQIGHVMLLNGGDRGFVTLRVYNDSTFVMPLIVRRGVVEEHRRAVERALNSCMTEGMSTYNTAGEVASADAQADDPCPGAGFIDIQELSRQSRNFFRPQDMVAYAEVIRTCADVLASTEDADVTALQEWLAEASQRFQLERVYFSPWRDGDVVWFDWLILFGNGAAALAQVVKGNLQPIYSTVRQQERGALLARVNIDTTPTETNVQDINIAFPRVSLKP